MYFLGILKAKIEDEHPEKEKEKTNILSGTFVFPLEYE